MTILVREWLLGFQSSHASLLRTHVSQARDHYSVCSELSLIMMGAGIAVSALPQRISVEAGTDRPSRGLPREAPRLAESRLRWPVLALLVKGSEP